MKNVNLNKSIVMEWIEGLHQEITDTLDLDVDYIENIQDIINSLNNWHTDAFLWKKNNADYNTLVNFLSLSASLKYELVESIIEEFNLDLPEDNYSDIINHSIKFFENKLTKYSKSSSNRSSNGKENKMLKKITDTVITDGQEVALRLAAKQLAKSFQEPICAFLIGKLGLENNSESKNKVLSVLQSDLGLGMISMGLSLGVGSLPLPENIKDHVQKLTKELRIMGEMSVSEPVVEMFVAPLRMMLTDQVLSIPLLQQQMQNNQLPEAKIEMQEVVAEVVKAKKTTKTRKSAVK